MTLSMRVQPEGAPDAMNGGYTDLGVCGHRVDAPVGGALGYALEGLVDQLGNLLVGYGEWTAGTHLIVKTSQSVLQIALPPLAHHVFAQAELFCNGLAGQPPGWQLGQAVRGILDWSCCYCSLLSEGGLG